MPNMTLEASETSPIWRFVLAAAAVGSLYSGVAQYGEAALGGPRPLYFVAALLAGSLAVLAAEPHRPSRALSSPLLLWIFAYLLMSTVWAVWRISTSPQTDQALIDRYRSMAFLVSMIIVFDERRARHVGRIGVVLVALATGVACIAEELGLFTFTDNLARTAGRAGGLYGNPNQAGLAMVFGLAAGITAVPRALRIPVLLLGAAGIGATFSRAAMLCLCVLVVVLVWKRELDLLPTVLATAGVAAVLAVTGGRVETWLDTGGSLNNDTLGRISMQADDSGRAALAAKVWRMFLDAPWFGHGMATEQSGRISHNLYLSLAAEHGILGLLMFPALLVALMVRHREALAFTLVFLLAGFFGHGYLEQEPTLLCVALAAAMPLASEEDGTGQEVGEEPPAQEPPEHVTA